MHNVTYYILYNTFYTCNGHIHIRGIFEPITKRTLSEHHGDAQNLHGGLAVRVHPTHVFTRSTHCTGTLNCLIYTSLSFLVFPPFPPPPRFCRARAFARGRGSNLSKLPHFLFPYATWRRVP